MTRFFSEQLANPFTPKSEAQILADLDRSEQEVAEGKCQDATLAVMDLRKLHALAQRHP